MDDVQWNGFECKWMECGSPNCKMSISMMVPDGVDVEHEVVKCGMCIVKEINDLRKENESLGNEVKEWKMKTMNKKKEEIEVKRQEEE